MINHTQNGELLDLPAFIKQYYTIVPEERYGKTL
jgi:hypothetical protein